MLQNIKELYGNRMAATDGDIGHVRDFYFDDQSWAIRYVVVNTGSWLTGRLVLLSPHAFGQLDRNDQVLLVHLTRKQIEASPAIGSHRPVSRQFEQEYYDHYGWPPYWLGGGTWGADAYPVPIAAPSSVSTAHHGHNQRDDVHLRSTKDLMGYTIHATDGRIGTVSGFRIDDRSWVIGELAVAAGPWYANREILLPTAQVASICYEDSEVYVNVAKADLQRAPEQGVVHAGA